MAAGNALASRLETITVGRCSSYRPLMIANNVVSSKSLGFSLLTPISSRMSSDGLMRLDRIWLSLCSLVRS
ncbi:hypothetical protein D3C84_999420 [compost metagenome]